MTQFLKTKSLKAKLLGGLAAAFLAGVLTTPASAAEKEVVAYRLTQWKASHFDDQARAKQHYETVKKLGCEVKTEDHGGHFDVVWRCPQWREMALPSHDAAHKWESWLKASGFETRHEH